MVQKLTHAEHDARAMLIGLVYDWRDGTYCSENSEGDPNTACMLDAITLEPVELITIHNRLNSWGHRNQKYRVWARPETPYAFKEEMDDG
jgi:hypothetical protein